LGRPRNQDVSPGCVVDPSPLAIGKALAEVLARGGRSNGYEIVRRDLAEATMVRSLLRFYLEPVPKGAKPCGRVAAMRPGRP